MRSYTLQNIGACVFVYDVTDRDSFNFLDTIYAVVCETRPIREAVDPVPKPRSRRAVARSFIDRALGHRPPEQASTPIAQPPPVPLFVIANKIDQPRSKWVVTLEEGMKFSERIGAAFYSLSAGTGEGCGRQIVYQIGQSIIRQQTVA